jgi:hypothetical protein
MTSNYLDHTSMFAQVDRIQAKIARFLETHLAFNLFSKEETLRRWIFALMPTQCADIAQCMFAAVPGVDFTRAALRPENPFGHLY